jgi:microcystin degradation protein MlrC
VKVPKRVTVAMSGLTFAGAAALTVGWATLAGDQALSAVAQQVVSDDGTGDLDVETLRRIAAYEEALRLRRAEEAVKLRADNPDNPGGAGGAGNPGGAGGTGGAG